VEKRFKTMNRLLDRQTDVRVEVLVDGENIYDPN
jgi:hypothetical protein